MKLSIITINRNNADGLRRTLESTFDAQPGFNDWEQIVVDGASTDGSFAVLDKWKDDPHLGWHVSEPDKGIYNAMNKGAAHARGEYLLFLNSGDMLLDNSLQEVFAQPICEDLVISNMLIRRNGVDTSFFHEKPLRFDPVYFLFRNIPHQGTMISKRLHDLLGGYDETLIIAADHKFFFRCFTEGVPSVRWLCKPFSRFFTDGTSHRYEHRKTIHDEWEEILVPYFGKEIASRAGLPLDDRPWIRGDVVFEAQRDRDLSHILHMTTSVIFRLWHVVPMRFLLRGIGKTTDAIRNASHRLFRFNTNRTGKTPGPCS